jgi:hypothetical protein
MAQGALGTGKELAAVLPAYPWCGMQFREPDTGKMPIRFLMGDIDNWVSVVHSARLMNRPLRSAIPIPPYGCSPVLLTRSIVLICP